IILTRYLLRLSLINRLKIRPHLTLDFCSFPSYFFFSNYTSTTDIYSLSLHDALPILGDGGPLLLFPLASLFPPLLAPQARPHAKQLPHPIFASSVIHKPDILPGSR